MIDYAAAPTPSDTLEWAEEAIAGARTPITLEREVYRFASRARSELLPVERMVALLGAAVRRSSLAAAFRNTASPGYRALLGRALDTFHHP
ncbi:MAG: hypothetical protein M3068_06250 [Gemmatimonadota bacterium]|nr:hypothetical protein [Gemmatimonadota bacterium]